MFSAPLCHGAQRKSAFAQSPRGVFLTCFLIHAIPLCIDRHGQITHPIARIYEYIYVLHVYDLMVQ